MDTILTVKNEHLERLRPEGAIDFFRELLWAEATSLGIAKTLINIPSKINVADGGIDAEVRDVQISDEQGIIKQGLTRYQIKTGDFNLREENKVRDILFKKKTSELKPRVKSCLDNDGTLVVVLFGYDDPETTDGQLDKKFRDKLINVDSKYENAKIEVWRQNTLRGFLQPFPALALKANGRHQAKFETHQDWASHDDMESDFLAGEEQEKLISTIRTELHRGDEPVHIHIWGEPGFGKTRLVLETTDTDDLRPFVIYCAADNFPNSELMNIILRDTFHAILILDECDSQNRKDIWNRLKYHSPRIKFVSIYDENAHDVGLQSFKVPPLQEKQISGIIQRYNISEIRADSWAKECEGSPKVAHVIGQHVMMDSADILKSLDDIWERYIAGSDDKNSQKVEQRRRVLRYISLFKRFGYGCPVADEAKAITKMIHQADLLITWPRFQEIVYDLRKCKILQGVNTLHITPKLLHITLWTEWWDIYGEHISFDKLLSLPDSLRGWAVEMFKYAKGSDVAFRIIRELLSVNGPFHRNSDYFKRNDSTHLFRVLTEVEPELGLRCLRQTIGTWSKEELRQWEIGRGEIVRSLENIAMWKSLFADAARLLLALAETEDEFPSNDARKAFVQLFAVYWWDKHLSKTEASPQERFPLLKEALESCSEGRRMIALDACNLALKTPAWGFITDTHRLFGKEPELWAPGTWGELFDAYSQVWQYLSTRLDTFSEIEQQKAVDILLESTKIFGGLGYFRELDDMVIETIETLSQKPSVDKKKVLKTVLWMIDHEGKYLPEITTQGWRRIKEKLTGSDFHSLMKRYIGMNVRESRKDEAPLRIEELAHQAFEHQDLLRSELNWLVTTQAENGYYFGYALGKKDETLSLLPTILEAQKHAQPEPSVLFLSGYLRVVFEHNQQKWGDLMDACTQDETLHIWVPELTWRSGRISDEAALRMLDSIKKGVAHIGHFHYLVFGGMIRELSENVFTQWIEFLLSHPDSYAIHIALDLFHTYYMREKSFNRFPKELTLKLLTHPSLSQKPEGFTQDPLFADNWETITKAFIQQYPSQRGKMADLIFEHFGEETSIFHSMFSPAQVVLLEMIQQYPEEVWAWITKYLEPPRDSRAFYLTNWLRGADLPSPGMEIGGVLPMFPIDVIWQWVDENVEERAPYLASFVPNKLFREENRLCWAQELLIRYGDRKDVRDHLITSFLSYGWTGSQSVYLQNKRQELLDFREEEENEHVRRWIDEYVAVLEHDIERVNIEEERRGF